MGAFTTRRGLSAALLPFVLVAGPAIAAECVVDTEAYVIRSALPDEAAIVDEQSAATAGWYLSGEPIAIGGASYVKDGGTLTVSPGEVEFHDLIGSVPIFRPAGSAGDSPILFASVDPLTCEVQPYRLAN